MKNYSKSVSIITSIIIAMFISSISFAQDNPHKRPSKEDKKQRIEQLANDLNLSEDQKIQFHAIHKEAHQKRKEIKKSEANKELMKQVNVEKKDKLQTLLSEDQFKMYRQKMSANRKKHSHKG